VFLEEQLLNLEKQTPTLEVEVPKLPEVALVSE
jgi:hypothetical protein